MNGFLDGVSVGLLLIAGFGYAIYALGPKSLCARSLTGAAALLGRLPVPGLRGLAGRLAAAASRAGAACGGCGTCGANPAAAEPGAGRGDSSRAGVRDPHTGAGAQIGVSEIHVPLSKIGRRH